MSPFYLSESQKSLGFNYRTGQWDLAPCIGVAVNGHLDVETDSRVHSTEGCPRGPVHRSSLPSGLNAVLRADPFSGSAEGLSSQQSTEEFLCRRLVMNNGPQEEHVMYPLDVMFVKWSESMAICGGAEDTYGRLGTTKAVTPRKEGSELGGEMRSGKTK